MRQVNISPKKEAEILKVLGHPTRIQIICVLKSEKNRNASVKQIQEQLGLSQVETSRHLIVLKNVSVLGCKKEGSHSCYFINNSDSFINELTECLDKSMLMV